MQLKTTRRAFMLTACAAAAVLIAACGGGSAAGPKTSISRVVVAGDSLADVGTFGMKFTVQNAANPTAGFPIFPQVVAQNFGIASQCNFYASATGGASFTTNPSCTNFAVGGGRVVNPASQGGAAAPFAVPAQLATAATVNGGAWAPTDLLL